MCHQINSIYIKLVGNHPRLPITEENINFLTTECYKLNNDVTIGCLMTNMLNNVHLTLCYIPWNNMEEYSVNIKKNVNEFEKLKEINFTPKCLSKFCTKLVIVYDEDSKIYEKILEECYPKYNPNTHKFHISIPLKFDYESHKYIPVRENIRETDLKFWFSYIKNLRFVKVNNL
jgi:hypothetical protein